MILFRFSLLLTLVVSPSRGVLSGEAVEIDDSRIPDVNKKARVQYCTLKSTALVANALMAA
jgi:hypothetical protein